MPTYLGDPGNLVALRGTAKERETPVRQVQQRMTLGGHRFAFIAPTTHREWDLELPPASTATDLSLLNMFQIGVYGTGPWVVITDWMAVTNIITPAQSLPGLDGRMVGVSGDATASTKVALPGGLVVPSVTSGGGVVAMGVGTAIAPGMRVTGSAYVVGGSASVTLRWVNLSGASLGETTAGRGGGPALTRLSSTGVAPKGATHVHVMVRTASVIAAPAITLSSELLPWSVGRGCTSVVLTQADTDVVRAASNGARGAGSFTLMEVGVGA